MIQIVGWSILVVLTLVQLLVVGTAGRGDMFKELSRLRGICQQETYESMEAGDARVVESDVPDAQYLWRIKQENSDRFSMRIETITVFFIHSGTISQQVMSIGLPQNLSYAFCEVPPVDTERKRRVRCSKK